MEFSQISLPLVDFLSVSCIAPICVCVCERQREIVRLQGGEGVLEEGHLIMKIF